MSDGASDATRAARLLEDVESHANALAAALLATGDPVFHTVNPAAVRAANDELAGTGLVLVAVPIDLGSTA